MTGLISLVFLSSCTKEANSLNEEIQSEQIDFEQLEATKALVEVVQLMEEGYTEEAALAELSLIIAPDVIVFIQNIFENKDNENLVWHPETLTVENVSNQGELREWTNYVYKEIAGRLCWKVKTHCSGTIVGIRWRKATC